MVFSTIFMVKIQFNHTKKLTIKLVVTRCLRVRVAKFQHKHFCNSRSSFKKYCFRANFWKLKVLEHHFECITLYLPVFTSCIWNSLFFSLKRILNSISIQTYFLFWIYWNTFAEKIYGKFPKSGHGWSNYHILYI